MKRTKAADLSAWFLAGMLVATPVSLQASQRGELLYQNHCRQCHEQEVHFRPGTKTARLDDLRYWVVRWEAELGLDWDISDVEDVVDYLNSRFYHFTERP